MDEGSAPAHSWFGPTLTEVLPDAAEESGEFVRLWQAFMTARLTLGSVLALLQTALFLTNATKFGGKMVFLIGIAATSVLTLATPLLAKSGTGFLITTRILEGLFEVVSFTYSCTKK